MLSCCVYRSYQNAVMLWRTFTKMLALQHLDAIYVQVAMKSWAGSNLASPCGLLKDFITTKSQMIIFQYLSRKNGAERCGSCIFACGEAFTRVLGI